MYLKKLFILAYLFFHLITSYAQSSEGAKAGQFTVNDFSPDYYGKIYRTDSLDSSSDGWVAVYDKKTHKELIKWAMEEEMEGEKEVKEQRWATTPTKILSYAQQDYLLYEDFNFDGVNDFALNSGPLGCYGGSLYKVYLATKKGFVFNEAFTELAEESCGMFTVDKKNKLINVSSRAGCCQYGSSDYRIKNNQPYAIRTEEVKYEPPVVTTTLETWEGQKRTSKTFRKATLEQDLAQHVFSFTLEKNNKKVLLLSTEKINLHYLFLNTKEEVELAYPLDSEEETPLFHLITTEKGISLSFANKGVKYEVYQNKEAGSTSVGIIVTVNGKATVLQGLPSSIKGSLTNVSSAGFDNVKIITSRVAEE